MRPNASKSLTVRSLANACSRKPHERITDGLLLPVDDPASVGASLALGVAEVVELGCGD